MNIIDLTHTIHKNMTVFPGTEAPSIENLGQLDKEGYIEKRITMLTHTGTHIDAPCHILEQGRSLDEFPAGKFFGKCYMVNCRSLAGGEISTGFLEQFNEKIQQADFIILNTGWHEKWESPDYFSNFPTLTSGASFWLTGFKLKAIGIDAISIDKIDSANLPNHHNLLSKEILIIENLTRLDQLPANEFIFSCLPMKIEKADGSPVRAIAIFDS